MLPTKHTIQYHMLEHTLRFIFYVNVLYILLTCQYGKYNLTFYILDKISNVGINLTCWSAVSDIRSGFREGGSVVSITPPPPPHIMLIGLIKSFL